MYGPVQPSLYHELKIFGADPVRKVFSKKRTMEDDDSESKIIEELINIYKSKELSPSILIAYTHAPIGAWSQCYQANTRHNIITNQAILEEYHRRLQAEYDNAEKPV